MKKSLLKVLLVLFTFSSFNAYLVTPTFAKETDINIDEYEYYELNNEDNVEFYMLGYEVETLTEEEYHQQLLDINSDVYLGRSAAAAVKWFVKVAGKIVGYIIKNGSSIKRVVIEAVVSWVIDKALDHALAFVKSNPFKYFYAFIANSSGNLVWEENGQGCLRPIGSNNIWSCISRLA